MSKQSSKSPRASKARKVAITPAEVAEGVAQIEAALAPQTTDVEGNRFEPKPKAAFRGAGFVKFRAEHDPRWCEKAQKHVHDNEDDLADQLAYEIATYGWWSAPLVIEHLGHKLHELRAKYASLNAGMVRMNLGNQIRASIRRARKQAEAAK